MWFYYIQWKSMMTNVYIVISVRCPNVAQHCCYQNSAVHCGGRSPERGCNACESINRTCRIANRGPASQTHKHTRILLNLLLAIYTSRLVLMAIINHRNYSREWCFGGVWPCTRWWCCCLLPAACTLSLRSPDTPKAKSQVFEIVNWIIEVIYIECWTVKLASSINSLMTAFLSKQNLCVFITLNAS